MWAPVAIRAVRTAAYQASRVVRTKLAAATRPVQVALEPAVVRSTHPRQPIHPAALLRQAKNRRLHSTTSTSSYSKNINAAVRRFISTGRLETSPRLDRSKFLGTQTGRAVAQSTGRAPFASTLRPNLTGGALPRTAGGYGLGSGRVGGARYFSHTPATQAHVVQNVSAAVRAFWISGQRAQFNGMNGRGDSQYRTISAMQHETMRKLSTYRHNAPGSYVDFRINPTVTALSPLAGAFSLGSTDAKADVLDTTSLNTEGFLDVLSSDFARALKDLTSTLGDLRKLAALGDLPVQLENRNTLRVRFPGVDAERVESLCQDLGLTRGLVSEDPALDADIAAPTTLRFPFAPEAMSVTSQTPTSSGVSMESFGSFPDEAMLFEEFSEVEENPWMSSPDADTEGYQSMSPPASSREPFMEHFEDLEGIYRFLEECDREQGRF